MFAYFIVRQRWRREEEETRLMYQFVENIIGRFTSELHIFLVHAKLCGVKLQRCIEVCHSLDETIWQCLFSVVFFDRLEETKFCKTEFSLKNID